MRLNIKGFFSNKRNVEVHAVVALEKWRNLTPSEVQLARHALGEFSAMFFCEEEEEDNDKEPLPELNLISVVCESNNTADIASLSSRLLSNELLHPLHPDTNVKFKYRTLVHTADNNGTITTTVFLQPYSCAPGEPHQEIVFSLLTDANLWCRTNAPHCTSALSDTRDIVTHYAPDVTIHPRPHMAVSRFPRFIIEVEVCHRTIAELRRQVQTYFSHPEDVHHDLCGVLAVDVCHNVQAGTLRAAAVLWSREPVTNLVFVEQTFDFGPDPLHHTQRAAWCTPGVDMAPPVAAAFVRYDPCTPGWPAAPGVVAVWNPRKPTVTLPAATMTHNYHPDIVFGALDDLQLDLARALECGAQSNWNVN